MAVVAELGGGGHRVKAIRALILSSFLCRPKLLTAPEPHAVMVGTRPYGNPYGCAWLGVPPGLGVPPSFRRGRRVGEEHHREADEVSVAASLRPRRSPHCTGLWGWGLPTARRPHSRTGRCRGGRGAPHGTADANIPPQDHPPGWIHTRRVHGVQSCHLWEHPAVHPGHHPRHVHAGHRLRRVGTGGGWGGIKGGRWW